MADSGGRLGVIEAEHRARAESAAGTLARPASTFDAVKTQSGRLDAGIVAGMEAQLLDYVRKAVATARRKLENGLRGISALARRTSAPRFMACSPPI